jgi:hypothetical protein
MNVRRLWRQATDTPNFYSLSDALALCGVDEHVALKIQDATERHGSCPLVTKKRFAKVFITGELDIDAGVELVDQLPWIFKDREKILTRLKNAPIPAHELLGMLNY